MSRRGPLTTLVAVLAVGLVMLLVNVGRAAPGPVAAAPTAAAPPARPAPAVSGGVYAGRTSGDELTIAIAVGAEGRAVGYLCDGERVEAWMEGALVGGELSLTGDGATVTGTVTAADVLGTATVGDRYWPYSAATAVPPSGLYEGRADVRGAVARIGWILLPDGTQVGVRDVGGLLSPAPPLDVGDATTIDATTIDATTIDGVPVDVRPVTGRTA